LLKDFLGFPSKKDTRSLGIEKSAVSDAEKKAETPKKMMVTNINKVKTMK
jgi:hypothetical protein